MRINDIVYLDYQASTPVDPEVMAAMEPLFRVDVGNPHSVDHAAGWAAQRAIDTASAVIAKLIGADADEIVFTSGATEANNLAMLGFAARAPINRRRLLVSAIEHKCVLAAGRAAASRYGLMLETIPVSTDGVVDLDAFAALIDDDVLSVAVMAVNNEIGTIQPLNQIGRLCAENGVIFHCDAAQAPLAMRLDVHELNIGSLSLSAHKVYGPKGIGVAFLRRDLQNQIEPLIYGGGQQRNLRSGTLPTPLCVGFGAAVSLLQENDWKAESERIRTMRDQLEEKLCVLGPFVKVNAAGVARHPGNLNIRFEGYNAEDILAAVQPNLAASTGSACTSGIPEPSHVLRAIALSAAQADASIRFSLGRFTVEDDIEIATRLVRDALSQIAVAA
jgi:cysteine desulfurase